MAMYTLNTLLVSVFTVCFHPMRAGGNLSLRGSPCVLNVTELYVCVSG